MYYTVKPIRKGKRPHVHHWKTNATFLLVECPLHDQTSLPICHPTLFLSRSLPTYPSCIVSDRTPLYLCTEKHCNYPWADLPKNATLTNPRRTRERRKRVWIGSKGRTTLQLTGNDVTTYTFWTPVLTLNYHKYHWVGTTTDFMCSTLEFFMSCFMFSMALDFALSQPPWDFYLLVIRTCSCWNFTKRRHRQSRTMEVQTNILMLVMMKIVGCTKVYENAEYHFRTPPRPSYCSPHFSHHPWSLRRPYLCAPFSDQPFALYFSHLCQQQYS